MLQIVNKLNRGLPGVRVCWTGMNASIVSHNDNSMI
jgi:hypothetical protein